MNLKKLIEEAKEELKERATGIEDYGKFVWSDAVHEVADSFTPIYTHDILECAMQDLWLASETNVNCRDQSPADVIAFNIYEKLSGELYDYAMELQDIEEEELA